MPEVPPDLALKLMNRTHRLILAASGGKVGWSASGMPVLELTTKGRRSGQPRKVMLTSPLQEGDSWVIVASRGGDDHHPVWYLNLVADPEVEVSVGGRPAQKMRAEVAAPAERDRMWADIAGRHRNYAGYQKKTSRQIPLVVLKPLPA